MSKTLNEGKTLRKESYQVSSLKDVAGHILVCPIIYVCLNTQEYCLAEQGAYKAIEPFYYGPLTPRPSSSHLKTNVLEWCCFSADQ